MRNWISILILSVIGSSVLGAELWVLQQDSAEVAIVEPTLLSVNATIDVSDPDGNSVVDTPWDLCFSTIPGQSIGHAFVVQGGLLTVISVPGRNIVHVHDLAAVLGLPGVSARACGSSVPRKFLTAGGGPVFKNYLHVAVTTTAGEARFAILDQDALVAGTAPLVESGPLVSGATAVDVHVLTTPAGNRHLRAWYTLTRPAELLSVPVDSGALVGAPSTVGSPQSVTLPPGAPPPETLRFGSPLDRELPIRPGGVLGTLENLDSGGECGLGGDLSAVAVTGVGPNAYTVLAADRSGGNLLLVEPVDCEVSTVGVGDGPVEIIPLDPLLWKGAYVLNHDSNDLTFVRPGGSTVGMSFGTGSGPIAGGFIAPPECVVDELNFARIDDPTDGIMDLQLTWDPCPSIEEYFIWCTCLDESPDCPCRCECPGDECCPALGPGGGGGGLNLLAKWPPWLVEFSLNPWKKLDSSLQPEYIHEDQGEDFNQQAYSVTTKDEAPPPP